MRYQWLWSEGKYKKNLRIKKINKNKGNQYFYGNGPVYLFLYIYFFGVLLFYDSILNFFRIVILSITL